MASDELISAEDLEHALTATCAILTTHKVHYALIGGVATSFRSQPRFTKDVDFLLNISQRALPRLLDDLKESGFTFDLLQTIQEWNEHHMAVLSYFGVRIDWLKPAIPMYAHILDRATLETWVDQPIRIASTEGLILLKLLAFRGQDQVDIENLLAAQRGHIDLDWIRTEWQTIFSLDDPRMQRFLEWAKAQS